MSSAALTAGRYLRIGDAKQSQRIVTRRRVAVSVYPEGAGGIRLEIVDIQRSRAQGNGLRCPDLRIALRKPKTSHGYLAGQDDWQEKHCDRPDKQQPHDKSSDPCWQPSPFGDPLTGCHNAGVLGGSQPTSEVWA